MRFPKIYFQTIGNHDFDNGIAGLVPFLKHIKSPVVVANLDITDEPTLKVRIHCHWKHHRILIFFLLFQGLFTNSTIIEKSGRKIGVIGALLSTSYVSNLLKFKKKKLVCILGLLY